MEGLHLIKCSVLHNWIKTVIRMRGDHEYFAAKLCWFDPEWPSDMKYGFYQACRCLHGKHLKSGIWDL